MNCAGRGCHLYLVIPLLALFFVCSCLSETSQAQVTAPPSQDISNIENPKRNGTNSNSFRILNITYVL